MKPVCVEDYRRIARRKLPRVLSEYVEGGSLTESARDRNVSDFQDIHLRQRVLGGVDSASLATNILGTDLTMPLVLAPVGMTGMYARRGEVQAARAAKAAGVIQCLSTMAVCDVREVVKAAGPVWYQLYLLRDRAYMKTLLQRVWDLGCPVLAFTVDVPVPGERLREHRQGLAGGLSVADEILRAFDGLMHPGWMWDVYLRGRPHSFGNVDEAFGGGGFGAFWTWVRDALQVGLTPDDIAWVRENWPGKLLIKGIIDPEDARLAVEAVGGRATVMMDGGVRSGEDIVRAMALGADGVMLGRAWVWALAARGEAGVAHVLELFRRQMATTMVLAGCDDVKKIGPGMLA